ncbi:MAG: 3,4-dihydroxy-2-butanone-4-phosphate synthase [Pseudomonadota bacterium]
MNASPSDAAQPGTLTLDPIELAIDDIRAGKMIVVVDDDDRENEGDLIMAAELASPEAVGFMIRHTSGILCAPIEAAEARRLNLPPMVGENDAPLATAFTVSVDYRHGLTTGISAEERCATVRALANPNAGAHDFVRPGHVFPLVAREGGVLMRTGHTEAGVDFSRLAGLRPASLLAELVNDDGTVMKGTQIETFARAHGLTLVSIDALIAYRQARERLIDRVGERRVQTAIGALTAIEYSTRYDNARHIALVLGEPEAAEAPLVRIQQERVLEDVFGVAPRGVEAAMTRLQAEGAGVFIYLRSGAAGVAEKPEDDLEADPDGEGAASDRARRESWRDVGLGAQIMRDLGLARVRVLASKERAYVGAAAFGVEIVGTELI